MSEAALKVQVFGVVQGVGFRFFTQRKARRLGLRGAVRNLPDGSVEAYAEGNREDLECWLDALREGPVGSVVSEVQYQWVEPTFKYIDFQIDF